MLFDRSMRNGSSRKWLESLWVRRGTYRPTWTSERTGNCEISTQRQYRLPKKSNNFTSNSTTAKWFLTDFCAFLSICWFLCHSKKENVQGRINEFDNVARTPNECAPFIKVAFLHNHLNKLCIYCWHKNKNYEIWVYVAKIQSVDNKHRKKTNNNHHTRHTHWQYIDAIAKLNSLTFVDEQYSPVDRSDLMCSGMHQRNEWDSTEMKRLAWAGELSINET